MVNGSRDAGGTNPVSAPGRDAAGGAVGGATTTGSAPAAAVDVPVVKATGDIDLVAEVTEVTEVTTSPLCDGNPAWEYVLSPSFNI